MDSITQKYIELKEYFPTIIAISYKRVFLYIDIYDEGERYFYLKRGKSLFLLEKEKIAENTYRVTINVSCVRNRTFLANGIYKIGFYDELLLKKLGLRRRNSFFSCVISNEVAKNLTNYDRVYRFGNNQNAYTISFNLNDTRDVLMHIELASFFMEIDRKWKRRSSSKPSSYRSRQARLRAIATKLFTIFLYAMYRMFTIFVKQKDVLIVYKFTGSLAGNLMFLRDRLLERDVDKTYRILLQRSDGGNEKMSIGEYIGFLRKLASAKFVFVDGPVPMFKFVKMSENTSLIQLWHAGAGFKGAGFIRFGVGNSIFPNNLSYKQVKYALAPSKPLIDVFHEVIGIEKDAFFVANMPRLEGFMDEDHITKVKEDFYTANPEMVDKKIILFAPTYRDVVSKGYYPYDMIDFDRIYEFLGDDKIFMVKMHPNILIRPDLSKYPDKIVDFSDQTEINDLLHITDVFITDYSSTYYEYGLLKKPMLFYCFDKLIYENTRGVYQSVDDAAPGKVVNTFKELMIALENEDYDFDKTLRFYDEFFGDYYINENASDYVIDNFLLPKEEDEANQSVWGVG
jgi:CDP-ribitol ribitolphosphotransferase